MVPGSAGAVQATSALLAPVVLTTVTAVGTPGAVPLKVKEKEKETVRFEQRRKVL